MSLLGKYAYELDAQKIESALQAIESKLDAQMTEENLKFCFSIMDLTTLKTEDTDSSVAALVEKVNKFANDYPNYPLPASICVYSNFAAVVNKYRKQDIHITVVSACFPSSQSFLDVKLLECEKAVEAGADEVDIVLALNSFLDKNYQAAVDEIKSIRKCIDTVAKKQSREVHLKVILETGLLSDEEIALASFLAMEAGADFIKTSTGKVAVNATPKSAYIMCECIKKYYEKTGKMIGFKPAGGISSAKDAIYYQQIVSQILGEEWLSRDYFRLGVSSLANKILTEVEKQIVKYF